MKCLGRTGNFERCANKGKPLFCHHHSRQPLGWLFVVVVTGGGFVYSVVGNTASILSLFGYSRAPVAERNGPIPAETNSPQSVSSPPVLPSPNESPTPTVAPTLAPTPSPTQAVNLSPQKRLPTQKAETASDHLNRARALVSQGRLDAALFECNKALGLEPKNQAVIELRNSIINLQKQ